MLGREAVRHIWLTRTYHLSSALDWTMPRTTRRAYTQTLEIFRPTRNR